MRRRDFLLGVASGTWANRTLLAWAQAPEHKKRIGVLLEYAEGDPEAVSRLAGVRRRATESWLGGRAQSCTSTIASRQAIPTVFAPSLANS